MKKFISKIKKGYRDFISGKAAFSLVELIVVIAIMAVMAAVLAPALLGYVERSRAQKDTSAMSEIVNSVQLSLADQDVYDEMLKYSAEQYSCYVDSDSPDEANKVDIKAGKYYMYNDNERQLDETVYKLDGVMRGVTITFAPDAAASNSATLDLIKGHVNKYLPSGKKTYGGLTGATASPKLADIADSELYNSLRATIGDKINISSQTYRNSEYTIFISMGTTGGQEAAAQDAIKVWGQFSGTNLPEGSSIAANGANAGTSAGSNEFKDPASGIPSTPTELTTLTTKTWNGLTSFDGRDVWTDGTNYYYSNGTQQYILNGDTWEEKIWNGLTSFYGYKVWTDGTNYYYSNGTQQYILNGDTWEEKIWNGFTDINGNQVWTDGTNYYYSGNYTHCVLNGNTWETKTWSLFTYRGSSTLTSLDGFYIWTDGINIYCSSFSGQYVLNNGIWENKDWDDIGSFNGCNVWTDGVNVYYSNNERNGGRVGNFVLNDGAWELKTWNGLAGSIRGVSVWTDGANYYYSYGSKQYVFS